jgi:hypothetical protein
MSTEFTSKKRAAASALLVTGATGRTSYTAELLLERDDDSGTHHRAFRDIHQLTTTFEKRR